MRPTQFPHTTLSSSDWISSRACFSCIQQLSPGPFSHVINPGSNRPLLSSLPPSLPPLSLSDPPRALTAVRHVYVHVYVYGSGPWLRQHTDPYPLSLLPRSSPPPSPPLQGPHSTKRVGEVTGSHRKPWKQKGTGRARHGSIYGPQVRHRRGEHVAPCTGHR